MASNRRTNGSNGGSSGKAAPGKEFVEAAKSKTIKDDVAATYNAYKEFEGRRYTGVKIGRGHKWHYQEGEWKERKVTPEEWEFTYAVNKRRAGHAPEGSGVPVGTQYHWYILAHQIVRKLDANEYTTSMIGVKHKLAHLRSEKGKWSASENAQRRRLIRILQEMIRELEAGAAGAAAPATAQPAPAKKPVRKKRRKELVEVG